MQAVALIVQNNLTSTDSTGGAELVRKNEGDIFMKCGKILSPMTGEAVGLGRSSGSGFFPEDYRGWYGGDPVRGKTAQSGGRRGYFRADTKHAFACVRQKAWSF